MDKLRDEDQPDDECVRGLLRLRLHVTPQLPGHGRHGYQASSGRRELRLVLIV